MDRERQWNRIFQMVVHVEWRLDGDTIVYINASEVECTRTPLTSNWATQERPPTKLVLTMSNALLKLVMTVILQREI